MLPPWVALVLTVLCAAAPAAAQERYRPTRDENFRAEPDPQAALLATVMEGTVLAAGSTRGGWVEVTLEGWIWGPSLGAGRAGYALQVSASQGENLRAEANGARIARVRTGTLFNEVGRRGQWVQVRRSGWMWRQSLERVGGATPPRTAPAPAAPAPAPAAPAARPDAAGSGPPTLDRVLTASGVPLLSQPDGDTTGTLAGPTPARVLARQGEWVRIQIEGWVRSPDVRPAGGGVLLGVTGAEVRARPEEFQDQLLQWTLQYLSLQTADELRREMPHGTRFMLARGPLPEAGFVYVMLTPAQLAQVEQLPPLAQLTIIGRLRVARSRYVGNPILELVDLASGQP